MITELSPLLHRTDVLIGALVLSTLVLLWIARRVRKIARSDRPDEALSNLSMLIGLGWSSEAVWEITGRADFPISLRLLLFFVLETLLVLAMIRAKRAVKDIGHPGRSGRTAWIVASAMALVGAGAAGSFGEAALRLLIPLLVTNQWWDGIVGEGAKQREGATSWRWTPRRLLLALGAIEPGERDVETVHRERLTQQMTRIEFRRRHGSKRQQERAASKLARLSLTADDDMISDVRRRVDRAMWFEPTQSDVVPAASPGSIKAALAASLKVRRVRHRRTLRTLRVTHPRPVIVAAQEPRQDERATQEIDTVVRVIREAHPRMPQRQIARLACVSEPMVRRALRRTQNPAPPPAVNGRRPELNGADR
jgi:hypothetical protein